MQEPPAKSQPKPWEQVKGDTASPDPLATRFVESLSYDRRLFRHDIIGSLAHSRMLEGVGLIDATELGAIESGLDQIETEIEQTGDDWPGWKPELEDVHMCIEAALIAKVGDPGRKLHTGRSRNDQVRSICSCGSKRRRANWGQHSINYWRLSSNWRSATA